LYFIKELSLSPLRLLRNWLD